MEALASLLRRLWRVIDERLDRSVLGSQWQHGKWQIAYRFRKNNRVPAFQDLIGQAHRRVLVETVIAFGDVGSVLEVGCGRGQNLYLLSQAIPGITLYGIDISGAVISQAARALEAKGISSVRLDVGSGETLTAFRGGTVDVVIADAVLMYVPPQRINDVIGEMLRVARKSIVLGTWHFEATADSEPWLYDEGTWVYDYRRLFERYSGLVVTVTPYPEGAWIDARWSRYGVVLTARVQRNLTERALAGATT